MDELTTRAGTELAGRPLPADCGDMAEVRAGVDALDRALVMLLAERVRYMDAAARIKPERAAVRDEARIEDVVGKVRAAAERHGAPPEIVEPVWRLLIERCIAYEMDAFDRLRT